MAVVADATLRITSKAPDRLKKTTGATRFHHCCYVQSTKTQYAHTLGSDAMPKTAGLLDSILCRRRDLANRIALEVSEQCDKTPLEWGSRDLQGRSIDFLRGYVRAKLAGAIHFETSNALRRHGAGPDLRPFVTALATERLVDLTIRRILNSQTNSTGRRRAA